MIELFGFSFGRAPRRRAAKPALETLEGRNYPGGDVFGLWAATWGLSPAFPDGEAPPAASLHSTGLPPAGLREAVVPGTLQAPPPGGPVPAEWEAGNGPRWAPDSGRPGAGPAEGPAPTASPADGSQAVLLGAGLPATAAGRSGPGSPRGFTPGNNTSDVLSGEYTLSATSSAQTGDATPAPGGTNIFYLRDGVVRDPYIGDFPQLNELAVTLGRFPSSQAGVDVSPAQWVLSGTVEATYNIAGPVLDAEGNGLDFHIDRSPENELKDALPAHGWVHVTFPPIPQVAFDTYDGERDGTATFPDPVTVTLSLSDAQGGGLPMMHGLGQGLNLGSSQRE